MKVLLLATLLAAQASAQVTPHFDVASVKHSPKRAGTAAFMRFTDTRGRLAYENITLKLLIGFAYQGDSDRMKSKEDWIDTAPYDVTAVFPAETTKAEVRAMMQTVLAERFGLVIHKVLKDSSGLELYADPKGTTLKPATVETEVQVSMLRGRVIGPRVTMPRLASVIGYLLKRPVVDGTGIEGNFDVDLRWARDAVEGVSETGDSIYSALKDQLGLRLRATRTTVETLVIDHANREPSEP